MHRAEKDRSEDDTILSRAMLRYFGDDTPEWLRSAAAASEPHIRVPTKATISNIAHSSHSRTNLDFLNRRPTGAPAQTSAAAAPARQASRTKPGERPELSAYTRERRQRLGEKLRGSDW